jgi:hypothetical protein
MSLSEGNERDRGGRTDQAHRISSKRLQDLHNPLFLVNYITGRYGKVILSMCPEHKLYCESFVGGGAVFFQKPDKFKVKRAWAGSRAGAHESKFLFNSFRNEPLQEAVKRNDWSSFEIRMSKPMSLTGGNKRSTKVEVLTANYPISAGEDSQS